MEVELLKPQEAAERVRVSRSTLDKMRHLGVGPRYIKFGGKVLYRVSDLNAYLDSRLVETKPVARAS